MARSTKTSNFGSNGWVGHDSSGYYARELRPLWLTEPNNDEVVGSSKPSPFRTKNERHRFFSKTSEDMSDLPDASVDLMVTSPPYNVGKDYDESLTVQDHVSLVRNVLKETYRVLVPGGRACVNVANIGRKPYIPLHAYIIHAAEIVGFQMRGEIVWNKSMNGASTAWGSWKSPANPTLRDTHEYIMVFQKPPFGRKRLAGREPTIERDEFLSWTKSVWEFAPASAKRLRHPAPFPVELPWRLVRLYTFSDEVVLDPFMGTGSAAVAALRAGRKFVGYDINKEYIHSAKERLKEEGLTEVYDEIATQSYNGITGDLNDEILEAYFNRCFNDTIRRFGLYPAWACMACISEGKTTAQMGKKPGRCAVCSSSSVYLIGNFQARGTRTGAAFKRAVEVLFQRRFNIDLTEVRWTPSKFDAENLMPIAVQAHGSPTSVEMPDGTLIEQGQPGLARSDTLKKARDDANSFKRRYSDGRFYVLTNETSDPPPSVALGGVDKYVNVTRIDELKAVARELKRAMKT